MTLYLQQSCLEGEQVVRLLKNLVRETFVHFCNIKITHKTHSLCCEICGIWYFLKCFKVPQAAYDALVEASGKQGSSCVFLCPCCKPSLPILSNINQTVNETKTSTSERFDNLETKVSDMEHTMDKLITREGGRQYETGPEG